MTQPVIMAAATSEWDVGGGRLVQYPQPEDAIDLGRLLSAATPLPRSTQPQGLGAWIDYAIGLFSHQQGTLLTGCSFLVPSRQGLLGAIIVVREGQQAWIRDLAVEPGFVRQGIGTVLLHHALRALHRSGYEQVRVSSPSDTPHAQLLARWGFAQEA